MNKWFVKNLAVVNLVLVVFGIISYMATIDLLVFWTNWGAQVGEIGGVLEYHPFSESVVYHVSKENLRAEPLFTFLDVTSYLLMALILFNGATLFIRNLKETEPGGIHVRNLAFRNLLVAILCMVIYV